MKMSAIEACVVDIALEMSFRDEIFFIMLLNLLDNERESGIPAQCGMNSIKKH